MSIEENKEIARRYLSVDANQIRKDIESGQDEFHAPELMVHTPMGDMNYEGYMASMNAVVSAFPDCKYNPEDVIAEGDKVVVRYTLTGTHRGDFQGIPATGKSFKIEGIGILRIDNGKLAEFWFASDMLGMMQQLGAIPAQ